MHSRECDGCSVELLPDSLFCHACGKPQPRSQPCRVAHGERKPITVLFVDAFGSIGLGDRLDAEAWHDVVESFFSIVSAGVARFGGTVDRLTGEGIKVLFGAPTALESHARQACHAALHIAGELADFGRRFRRSAGVEFSVRMGLNSGEVVFGPVGGDPDRAFTSQGHVAALAARMQQLAEPGQIYLTARTASQVADFFEMREVGPLPVRNASTTVQVFELVRAREHRSRLDAARERGLSRFVGRSREMAELEQALRLAHETGPRVVGIAGEPGVGKSRLGDEFAELQRSRGLSVHHTRCVEHGAWIPFHATQPFLRSELGIQADDDPLTVRERAARRVLALDPALEEALPVLFVALGVPLPGERAVGFAANDLARVCRTLVEARDALRPSLLVLDDAQWMDAASEAAFERLVLDPPRQAVLVIVSYRRGYRRPWMSDPTFSELTLQPLERVATLELVRSLLGDDPSLGELPARVVERASGNPFFVEEMVRALVESEALEGERGAYRLRKGAVEVRVPETLQAVLAARIDQLPEGEKAVLQAASVIGREFSASLLAAVTLLDASRIAAVLSTLEAADFVSAVGWGDDAIYRFRHPLLRETAYRSLLQERRAAIHREVAREVTRRHGRQVESCATQLALHYEAAGDLREAATWHRRAAVRTEPWDPVQSLEHWRRVFSCTRDDDGDDLRRARLAACEAIVRLGVHQDLSAEDARVYLHTGQVLAAGMGEFRATALLASAEGAFLGATGDVAGSIAHNSRALALATRKHDDELALLCGARLTLTHRMAGDLTAALATADATLAAHRDARFTATPGWFALRQLELARIGTLLDLGRLRLGEAELHRMIALLRDEDAAMILGWALTVPATIIRFSGTAAPHLVARVEEGHALARRLAVPSLLARALASSCVTRLFQRRPEEARALAEEAAKVVSEVRHAFYVDMNPALLLAHAHLMLGEHAAARAAASRALAYALERGSFLGRLDSLLCLGRILLFTRRAADHDEARRLLLHGLALVRRTRARSREPHLWLELARHARHGGNEAKCRTYQRRAVRLLIAMDALGHVRRSATLLGRLEPTRL
ncbi:MAG: AAA family ATPase [Thermodesulfobacteriota bacterium]